MKRNSTIIAGGLPSSLPDVRNGSFDDQRSVELLAHEIDQFGKSQPDEQKSKKATIVGAAGKVNTKL